MQVYRNINSIIYMDIYIDISNLSVKLIKETYR